MDEEHTTAAVQRFLDKLAGDAHAEPVVRALLDRAVRRLHQLCDALLHRGYPRLARPPLNLQADEMLSAVVERLLKAMREARPGTVRQFFALANQHMRWERNDMAVTWAGYPGTFVRVYYVTRSGLPRSGTLGALGILGVDPVSRADLGDGASFAHQVAHRSRAR